MKNTYIQDGIMITTVIPDKTNLTRIDKLYETIDKIKQKNLTKN